MTRNLRSGSDFIEARATSLAPRAYEIWINDVTGVPGFYQGLLERGLELVGAHQPQAPFIPSGKDSYTFHVTWQDRAQSTA
jgi:uncharacterized protein (TIGR02265 family)